MNTGVMLPSALLILFLQATVTSSADCPYFSPPSNGRIHYFMNGGSVYTAVFACKRGYAIIGDNKRVCQNGTWNQAPPACKYVDCGEPEDIENGHVSTTGTMYRDKALYTCNTCYRMDGRKRRSCKQSGVWSKIPPKCNIEELDFINLPDSNLKLETPLPVQCGTVIRVSCYWGYRVVGSPTATVLPGRSFFWHGEQPRCVP